MTDKIYWKVSEKPTGQYRSFFKRAWPFAYFDKEQETPAFSITCADDYIPANVKTGRHGELTIHVADWRKSDKAGSSFTWRTLKARAKTLDEAKAIAQRFADAHPEVFVP